MTEKKGISGNWVEFGSLILLEHVIILKVIR